MSLYYLRARYYNPLTGRFLSRDPKPGHIGIPHTQHKYLYASADPVDRIDPFGKSDLVEDEDAQAAPEAAEPGERQLASRINCILETSAGALNALSTIESGDILGSGFAAVSLVENWETCSGEATGKGGGKGGEGGEGGGKGGGNCCFAAGTPVHTNHGDVPVEKVVVGDEVVSRNRTNGKLESQHVTALTPPHKDHLVEVRVEGERTPLRPSLGHPFWVKRGDAVDGVWMEAGTMRVGDLLQTTQGDWRRVVSITPLEGQETVYNFTVAKDHDYFVGETGFLVHNIDCGCNPIFDRRDLHPDTVTGDNPRGLYPVKPTGSYSGDRQGLLDAAGIDNPGPGWAAHHQSFDPGTGMMMMQLVDGVVHSFFTHRGGVKDCGIPYVP